MDLFGSSDPNAGFLMPMAAQAMRYDPRSALIAQMLQSGQQQLQQPTYSPGAAFAKALTTGLGGLSSAYVTNQYMNAAKAAPAEIGKALAGGNGSNPVQSLISSGNPLVQSIGLGMMPEYYKPTVTSAGQQIVVPATGQNLAGNTTPLSEPGRVAHDAEENPNMGQENAGVVGQETTAKANAQNQSDLNYKPQIAGGVSRAELPAKAVESMLSQAGRVRMLGPNERGITGAEELGLGPLLHNLAHDAGVNLDMSTGTPGAPNPSAAAPQGSPNAASPKASPATQSVAPQGFDQKLWDEIPSVPKPTTPLRDASGHIQGVSSSNIDMENKANEEKVKIDQEGEAANSQLGQLATLKSTLASGQFNTNATAPLRATVSSYIQALTGDDGLAQKITGINPSLAQTYNKDSRRMGLQFARSTEGAREAVAAIKIALGANPSLENTMQANRQIIGLMQRAAQYDVDTQRASDAFYMKNQHNVGFSGWWNTHHPETDYITGKVEPYTVPAENGVVNTNMLIPGFTYQSPTGQVAEWTGKGFKPVQQ